MSDGAMVFNLQRGHTLKRSTVSPHVHYRIRSDVTRNVHQEQMGGIQTIQVNKEIYTKRDEETGTTLTPSMQSQVERKYSMETASSSKLKEVIEDLEVQ